MSVIEIKPKQLSHKGCTEEKSVVPTVKALGSVAARLSSIDAFRGLTVLGMLLVNNKASGAIYPDHLRHASWGGGVHFADMIFPWFILLSGVVIPFSSRADERLSYWKRTASIFRRSLILVLLGCLINSSYASRPVFDFGVLQLIGVSYFFAASVSRLDARRRIVIATGLLLAHWAAFRFFPVPGAGAGVFTEQRNFARFLDENFLGAAGMNGAMSVMTTTALSIIGSLIGEIVRGVKGVSFNTGVRVAAVGIALTMAGALWGFDMPMNKRLWTASYVVYAAGLGALGIGVFYLLIDVAGLRRWSFPLVVFGSNALFAFVVPILVNEHILKEWTYAAGGGRRIMLQQILHDLFVNNFGRVVGGWIFFAAFAGFWWLVMLGLYRKRIFFRV